MALQVLRQTRGGEEGLMDALKEAMEVTVLCTPHGPHATESKRKPKKDVALCLARVCVSLKLSARVVVGACGPLHAGMSTGEPQRSGERHAARAKLGDASATGAPLPTSHTHSTTTAHARHV